MSIDYSKFTIAKPKSKPKKRITVNEDTYTKVVNRDVLSGKGCQLKDTTCEGLLELHHIIYRSEDKSKINDVNNCIMLCTKHHKEVHSNKHYWQPKLKEIIENKKKGGC